MICFEKMAENFQNTTKKPIQEVFVTINEDGVIRKIPALNDKWVKLKRFSKYKPLPFTGNSADIEEWVAEMQIFNFQLDVMKKCLYFEFWSTLTQGNDFMDAIVSFVQNSNPCYRDSSEIYRKYPNVLDLYNRIIRNVMIILYRITIAKETDTEWMSEDDLAQTLYKNYLITVPLLFDILVTYGTGTDNLQILKKLFKKIFQLQPKYKEDLSSGLLFIKSNCFQSIGLEIEKQSKKLTSLNDLILFSLDSVTILKNLVDVYPDSVDICFQLELDQELTQFYDNIIPSFYKSVCVFENNNEVLEYLKRLRVECLKCFRSLVSYLMDDIFKKKPNNVAIVEKLLCMLTLALSDLSFVVDYQKNFKIQNDMEVLRQACPQMDFFKADFILQAYLSDEKVIEGNFKKIDRKKLKNMTLKPTAEAGPSKPPKIERDFGAETRQIVDLFPHLGDGFIRKLLNRYENTEMVISAIIEGNLPPDLAELDQTEVFIPPDPKDKLFEETGIHRSNVFNGDSCDVMVNDELNCKIRYKKAEIGQPKSIKALLNDKTHVKEMKSRYEEYAMINDYDDEYDDSYDAMAESESKKVKSFGAAKNILVDEGSSSSEEVEEESEQDKQKSRDNFCENPEVIRARREQYRNQKYGNRAGGNAGGSRDVVGAARGQGQSDAVLHNRQKKEANKSSRANHNRKQGANWKRNRGMIPS